MPNQEKFPVKTREQYFLEEEELIDNPESRTPIVVCVDCSFSMRQGKRLQRVMEGLETFCRDMAADEIASQSVELCIVSFGGKEARVVQDFAPPERIKLPQLTAEGETPLVDAVRTALQNIEIRKQRYDDNGVSFYRPWLILIGDGDETQSSRELDQVAKQLKEESDAKHLSVQCIVVGDEQKIQYASLMKLAPDGHVKYLRDLKFREFFGWLSRSIQKTSQSMSGEEVEYEPVGSWAEVLQGGQE